MSTASEISIMMENGNRKLAAVAKSFVAYVHPRNLAPLRTALARSMGHPIRRHGRAGSARARKRVLLRDWRPFDLNAAARKKPRR